MLRLFILCKFPLPEPWPVTGSSGLIHYHMCGAQVAIFRQSTDRQFSDCVREWLKERRRLGLSHMCSR